VTQLPISPAQVLTHMEVKGEPGLYVVGCFERRVTLSSQQVRALNLVYALHHEKQLGAGASIAIVGGSAAGMTAAAGAARLGYKVTLLERGDALLPFLRGNHTRWIHPHIYDWPEEGSERADAGLPLLDWTASLADEVARQIEARWDALPERSAIEVHHNARDIVLGPRVSWNADRHYRKPFAGVILAVGFGVERRVEGVPWVSYWDDDRLHQPVRGDRERHLVSGCGDGGLIDLLRVRVSDFRHERVVEELLGSPSLSALKGELLAIDVEARRQPKPEEWLWDRYEQLAVPAEVDATLASRLRRDTEAVLNGRSPTPFSLGASILNRFLVSRLLFKFGVPYRAGELTCSKVRDRYEVKFASGGKAELFDHVTCRHGPSPAPLEEHFPAVWTNCAGMSALAELDQTRTPIFGDAFGPVPSGSPGKPPAGPVGVVASGAPTVNNLRARNPYFRGRGEELAALEEVLGRDKKATITHASVFGLGGVGKTALALELAHRAVERGYYPGGVWWVAAEGKPVDALVTFAPVLRANAPEEVRGRLPQEETRAEAIAEEVRVALQGQRAASLLVLDNVSEPWGPYIPGGAVRVLVTTRDEGLAIGKASRLEVLSKEQAREVADAIAGKPPNRGEEDARDRVVGRELGGLAVAVEMAARAVHKWFRGSWSAYEGVLRKEPEKVLEDPKLYADYGRGVFKAIDLSIDKCDEEARMLLEGAAVLAPEAMPKEWALAAAGIEASSLTNVRATAALRELGLITVDEDKGVVSMHRLVHRWVRARAEAEHKQFWDEVADRAVKCVAKWIIDAVQLNQTRAEMEVVDARREHIDRALPMADGIGNDLGWIKIANDLATHLRNRVRYDDSGELYKLALERAETLTPSDPKQLAISLVNLAMLHQDLGQSAVAGPLLERGLAIDEATFGPADPQVALSGSRKLF
jgi:NB-ARC domain/Tetratricopeptide repeat/Pyridine nucleotide-disulphide oxidoreductase